jgi:hypothetical protein
VTVIRLKLILSDEIPDPNLPFVVNPPFPPFLTGKMSLQGVLSKYPLSSHKHFPYFTSGDLESKNAVVFIGGLTNGLMDPGYLVPLSAALSGAGWQL